MAWFSKSAVQQSSMNKRSAKKKKKNKHIKFDDDGNPMVATPSKVLAKAQRFLQSAALEGRDGDGGVMDAVDPDSVRSNPWQNAQGVDEDQESSDDADDVVKSDKHSAVASEEIKKERAETKLGSTDDSSSRSDKTGTSLVDHSQPKSEVSESVDGNSQGNDFMDLSHDQVEVTARRKKKKSQKKKQKKNRKSETSRVLIPPEVAGDAVLKKYWAQRYRLFAKFDRGIQLDYGLLLLLSMLLCVCVFE